MLAIINADSEDLRSVTAVVQKLPNKTKAASSGIGSGNGGAGDDVIEGHEPTQTEMSFSIDEFSRAIMARIVKKCGTRDYWDDWSTSIAEIAKNHITRLSALLKDPGTEARLAFDAFLAELRDDLNDSISEGDAIEMLAQHIITCPVFETLFEGHKFTAENPVSRAMQRVLDVLNEANLDKESRDLEKFYASVKMRSQGITDPEAKQKLIVELCDKFFRRAFPRTTEKLRKASVSISIRSPGRGFATLAIRKSIVGLFGHLVCLHWHSALDALGIQERLQVGGREVPGQYGKVGVQSGSGSASDRSNPRTNARAAGEVTSSARVITPTSPRVGPISSGSATRCPSARSAATTPWLMNHTVLGSANVTARPKADDADSIRLRNSGTPLAISKRATSGRMAESRGGYST